MPKYVTFVEKEDAGLFRHVMSEAELADFCRVLFLTEHFPEYKDQYRQRFGVSVEDDYTVLVGDGHDTIEFGRRCLIAYGVEPTVLTFPTDPEITTERYDATTGTWTAVTDDEDDTTH